MARIYANRIWAEEYDYNSIKKAYIKLKKEITAIMVNDVIEGKHTETEFEEITGLVYAEAVADTTM